MGPPDRLLEFDVRKHGWAEFAGFLGRPAPGTERFPHPRSRMTWGNDILANNNPFMAMCAISLLLALHVVNCHLAAFMLWLCWQLLRLLIKTPARPWALQVSCVLLLLGLVGLLGGYSNNPGRTCPVGY